MRHTTHKTFTKKTTDGDWEAMTDVSRSGMVEVRDAKTGKRFMVQVD